MSFRPDEHIRTLLDAFSVKKHVSKTKIINEALLAYLKNTDEKISKQVQILNQIDNDDDYLGEDL